MLGALKPGEVREALSFGDIFLNTSLTESFCIANLEAACTGLLVVSTGVGGVPETLPSDMMLMTETSSQSIVHVLTHAINHKIYEKQMSRVDSIYKWQQYQKIVENNRRLSKIYNWHDIAARTEKLYNHIT